MTRRSVVLAPFAALVTAAALVMPAGPAATAPPAPSEPEQASAALTPPDDEGGGVPDLTVTTVIGYLAIPWDLAFVKKKMIWTERDRERISVRMADGEIRTLAENPAGMWHSGETGLMGVVVDPNFANNRRIYTCHGYESGGTRDIRVVRWRVNGGWTIATQKVDVVTGIQIVSGRHGGCRLRFAPNGALHIGTGDAAVGTNPRDLTSLNGKTLRVRARTGAAWPGNPFLDSPNANTKLVYTYGHRNVQGLALRKSGQMWSAEHGSYRDDEVNKLKAGGDYGWHPIPGYNETVPMTDHSLPGPQVSAKWSSGEPTIATSGMAWLKGRQWGAWNGQLAVAALAGSELRLMEFGPAGALISEQTVAELDGSFGRLRAVQMGPQQTLYITTSNGSGDRILKVTPS